MSDLSRAQRSMDWGDFHGAMQHLAAALSEDPHDAMAHALLSLCLCQLKRVHGAEVEAREALRIDPELPEGLFALACMWILRRELGKAEEALAQLRAVAPHDPVGFGHAAYVAQLRGKHKQAREWATKALERNPDDADNHALIAVIALTASDYPTARAHAEDALRVDPENADAHGVMAGFWVNRDDIEQAREHALAALRVDPTEENALVALMAIKARGNPLTALWWHYNRMLARMGQERAIALIIGALVVSQYTATILRLQGYPLPALIITALVLVFAVYTWIAPAWFQRRLKAEAEDVKLGDDF